MALDHYDVIIIGSGPGGGAMAHSLAPTGKRILVLERGEYLPRERVNWDAKAVFVDGKYQVDETWYGTDGSSFHPGLHRFVGGNSKVYGAALFRLRERDFGEIQHSEGISPAWPIGYDAFEPYYAKAEKLFHVHGKSGEDPNEPRRGEFPYEAVSHEPMIQELSDKWAAMGLNPFHLPLGILLDEKNGKATPSSICIRCDAFDGFPCPPQRQGRCAGRLHRSDGRALPERDAHDRCLCEPARNEPGRQKHQVRSRRTGGPSGTLLGRHRRRGLRGAEFGPAVLAVARPRPRKRPRQRFRPGRPQLHAAQSVRADGHLEETQHDRLPEDLGVQRFLLQVRRLGLSARLDPNVRHDPRRTGAR